MFFLFSLGQIITMYRLVFIFILASVLSGCGPSLKGRSSSLESIPMELKGSFTDDYGISYSISDSVWTQRPNIKYYLLLYNSNEKYFIARNDDKNPSEGGLYSRIDITYFSGMEPYRWGFCLTAYKAKTADEAMATRAADKDNPKKGCGGFPFSRMKRI